MKITVIENDFEFERLQALIREESVIAIPILSDLRKHSCVNPPTLLAVSSLFTKELFILPIAHYDSFYQGTLEKLEFSTVYTPDVKIWMHQIPSKIGQLIDITSLEYLAHNDFKQILFPVSTELLRQYKISYANVIVPLVKWADAVGDYIEKIKESFEIWMLKGLPRGTRWLNCTALPTLAKIEQNGLCVDVDLWTRHFKRESMVSDGFVYTEYNLYTAAGRPSCRFGGVNFAAIPKNESRQTFISRYENGSLILLDYESFHVRLIADMIKTEISAEDIHDYFGRLYYGGISREESKNITFSHLYGDTDTTIPFFVRVREYRTKLWEQLQKNGYVLSKNNRELRSDYITDVTPAKLFNYLIQLRETEQNLTHLRTLINEVYKGLKSKIVLYNYDSILIDYCEDDGWDLINTTVELLEEGGKFPIKVKKGPNYSQLDLVKM